MLPLVEHDGNAKVAFGKTSYMSATSATTKGTKGYMTGFGTINVLVAEK